MRQVKRLTGLLTALTFLISNAAPLRASAVNPVEPETARVALSLDTVRVPEELGKIEEAHSAQDPGSFVTLIQDAHALPDAQKKIEALLEHFQKGYGIRQVALEGVSSQLDPQIFRSFPEKELLRKVFQHYFEQGEVTGPAARAVFGGSETGYQGIEDWELYEEGLRLYSKAIGKEPELLEKLGRTGRELEARKRESYSEKLLAIDRLLSEFYENQANLVAVLRALGEIKEPPPQSQVALLLEEVRRESKNLRSVEKEVEKLGLKVKTFLKSKATDERGRAALTRFNANYQEFRTGQISAEAFALFLIDLSREKGLSLKGSKPLLQRVKNQKRLRDLEGTRLFDEFERYAEEVKRSLFDGRGEEELDRETKRIRILKRLARLELRREEWSEVKERLQASGAAWDLPLKALFQSHLAFYENAESREEAFLKRLNSQRTLLVAGGFHTEGLTRRFKEKGISYVLVMPRIDSVPDETNYGAQMRGEMSWKKYFKAVDGRVSVYEAFVRGTRDRLLAAGAAPTLLKTWRDEIIRDLADQDRLAEAGKYTRFLDEVVKGKSEGPLDRVRAEWLANIDRFLTSLRGLHSEGRLTEQNLLQALKSPTAQSPVGAALDPAATFRPGQFGLDSLPGRDEPPVQFRSGELEVTSGLLSSLTPSRSEGLAKINKRSEARVEVKSWEEFESQVNQWGEQKEGINELTLPNRETYRLIPSKQIQDLRSYESEGRVEMRLEAAFYDFIMIPSSLYYRQLGTALRIHFQDNARYRLPMVLTLQEIRGHIHRLVIRHSSARPDTPGGRIGLRSEMQEGSRDVDGLAPKAEEVGHFHDGFDDQGLAPVDLPNGSVGTAELSKVAVYPEFLERLAEELEKIRSLLRPEARKSPRLLSLGLGNGILEERLMKGHGYQVSGIEVSEVQARKAGERGLRVQVGDLHKALPRVPEASQDIVYAGESIGYLKPSAVFLQAKRILAPGGLLVITSYPVEKEREYALSPTGYVGYPLAFIKEEFQRAGFENFETREIRREEFPGSDIQRYFHRPVIQSILIGRKTLEASSAPSASKAKSARSEAREQSKGPGPVILMSTANVNQRSEMRRQDWRGRVTNVLFYLSAKVPGLGPGVELRLIMEPDLWLASLFHFTVLFRHLLGLGAFKLLSWINTEASNIQKQIGKQVTLLIVGKNEVVGTLEQALVHKVNRKGVEILLRIRMQSTILGQSKWVSVVLGKGGYSLNGRSEVRGEREEIREGKISASVSSGDRLGRGFPKEPKAQLSPSKRIQPPSSSFLRSFGGQAQIARRNTSTSPGTVASLPISGNVGEIQKLIRQAPNSNSANRNNEPDILSLRDGSSIGRSLPEPGTAVKVKTHILYDETTPKVSARSGPIGPRSEVRGFNEEIESLLESAKGLYEMLLEKERLSDLTTDQQKVIRGAKERLSALIRKVQPQEIKRSGEEEIRSNLIEEGKALVEALEKVGETFEELEGFVKDVCAHFARALGFTHFFSVILMTVIHPKAPVLFASLKRVLGVREDEASEPRLLKNEKGKDKRNGEYLRFIISWGEGRGNESWSEVVYFRGKHRLSIFNKGILDWQQETVYVTHLLMDLDLSGSRPPDVSLQFSRVLHFGTDYEDYAQDEKGLLFFTKETEANDRWNLPRKEVVQSEFRGTLSGAGRLLRFLSGEINQAEGLSRSEQTEIAEFVLSRAQELEKLIPPSSSPSGPRSEMRKGKGGAEVDYETMSPREVVGRLRDALKRPLIVPDSKPSWWSSVKEYLVGPTNPPETRRVEVEPFSKFEHSEWERGRMGDQPISFQVDAIKENALDFIVRNNVRETGTTDLKTLIDELIKDLGTIYRGEFGHHGINTWDHYVFLAKRRYGLRKLLGALASFDDPALVSVLYDFLSGFDNDEYAPSLTPYFEVNHLRRMGRAVLGTVVLGSLEERIPESFRKRILEEVRPEEVGETLKGGASQLIDFGGQDGRIVVLLQLPEGSGQDPLTKPWYRNGDGGLKKPAMLAIERSGGAYKIKAPANSVLPWGKRLGKVPLAVSSYYYRGEIPRSDIEIAVSNQPVTLKVGKDPKSNIVVMGEGYVRFTSAILDLTSYAEKVAEHPIRGRHAEIQFTSKGIIIRDLNAEDGYSTQYLYDLLPSTPVRSEIRNGVEGGKERVLTALDTAKGKAQSYGARRVLEESGEILSRFQEDDLTKDEKAWRDFFSYVLKEKFNTSKVVTIVHAAEAWELFDNAFRSEPSRFNRKYFLIALAIGAALAGLLGLIKALLPKSPEKSPDEEEKKEPEKKEKLDSVSPGRDTYARRAEVRGGREGINKSKFSWAPVRDAPPHRNVRRGLSALNDTGRQKRVFNIKVVLDYLVKLFKDNPKQRLLPSFVGMQNGLSKEGVTMSRETLSEYMPSILEGLAAVSGIPDTELNQRIAAAIGIRKDLVGAAARYIIDLFDRETDRTVLPSQPQLSAALGPSPKTFSNYFDRIVRRLHRQIQGEDGNLQNRIRKAIEAKEGKRHLRRQDAAGDHRTLAAGSVLTRFSPPTSKPRSEVRPMTGEEEIRLAESLVESLLAQGFVEGAAVGLIKNYLENYTGRSDTPLTRHVTDPETGKSEAEYTVPEQIVKFFQANGIDLYSKGKTQQHRILTVALNILRVRMLPKTSPNRSEARMDAVRPLALALAKFQAEELRTGLMNLLDIHEVHGVSGEAEQEVQNQEKIGRLIREIAGLYGEDKNKVILFVVRLIEDKERGESANEPGLAFHLLKNSDDQKMGVGDRIINESGVIKEVRKIDTKNVSSGEFKNAQVWMRVLKGDGKSEPAAAEGAPLEKTSDGKMNYVVQEFTGDKLFTLLERARLAALDPETLPRIESARRAEGKQARSNFVLRVGSATKLLFNKDTVVSVGASPVDASRVPGRWFVRIRLLDPVLGMFLVEPHPEASDEVKRGLAMKKKVFFEGGHIGIGRGESNQIVDPDPSVSKRQARITITGLNELVIRDIQSNRHSLIEITSAEAIQDIGSTRAAEHLRSVQKMIELVRKFGETRTSAPQEEPEKEEEKKGESVSAESEKLFLDLNQLLGTQGEEVLLGTVLEEIILSVVEELPDQFAGKRPRFDSYLKNIIVALEGFTSRNPGAGSREELQRNAFPRILPDLLLQTVSTEFLKKGESEAETLRKLTGRSDDAPEMANLSGLSEFLREPELHEGDILFSRDGSQTIVLVLEEETAVVLFRAPGERAFTVKERNSKNIQRAFDKGEGAKIPFGNLRKYGAKAKHFETFRSLVGEILQLLSKRVAQGKRFRTELDLRRGVTPKQLLEQVALREAALEIAKHLRDNLSEEERRTLKILAKANEEEEPTVAVNVAPIREKCDLFLKDSTKWQRYAGDPRMSGAIFVQVIGILGKLSNRTGPIGARAEMRLPEELVDQGAKGAIALLLASWKVTDRRLEAARRMEKENLGPELFAEVREAVQGIVEWRSRIKEDEVSLRLTDGRGKVHEFPVPDLGTSQSALKQFRETFDRSIGDIIRQEFNRIRRVPVSVSLVVKGEPVVAIRKDEEIERQGEGLRGALYFVREKLAQLNETKANGLRYKMVPSGNGKVTFQITPNSGKAGALFKLSLNEDSSKKEYGVRVDEKLGGEGFFLDSRPVGSTADPNELINLADLGLRAILIRRGASTGNLKEALLAARSPLDKLVSFFSELDQKQGEAEKTPLERLRQTHGGVFLPSNLSEVAQVLKRINLREGEKFVDLGSGDGRVVFLASLFGAIPEGFETDANLFHFSKKLLAKEPLKSLVRGRAVGLYHADFSRENFGEYDVIFYAYSGSRAADEVFIQKKILDVMKPEARLVIHAVPKERELKFPETFDTQRIVFESSVTYVISKKEADSSRPQRSEARSAESERWILKSLIEKLHPKAFAAIGEETLSPAVTIVKTEGIEPFVKAFRKATEELLAGKDDTLGLDSETLREAGEALLKTIKEPTDQKEKSYTIGIIFTGGEGPLGQTSFTNNFLKALGKDASIRTVAISGKFTSEVSNRLKEAGKQIRPVSQLSRPLVLSDQEIVPTAIVGEEFKDKLHEYFLPFWIERGSVDNPLVQDYAEQLQLVALAHTAKILDEQPELGSDPENLRAELLRRLALFEDFGSLIQVGQRWGRYGFVISAAIARAYLEHQAELRISQAA